MADNEKLVKVRLNAQIIQELECYVLIQVEGDYAEEQLESLPKAMSAVVDRAYYRHFDDDWVKGESEILPQTDTKGSPEYRATWDGTRWLIDET